jgi:hypothetical protein
MDISIFIISIYILFAFLLDALARPPSLTLLAFHPVCLPPYYSLFLCLRIFTSRLGRKS